MALMLSMMGWHFLGIYDSDDRRISLVWRRSLDLLTALGNEICVHCGFKEDTRIRKLEKMVNEPMSGKYVLQS